MFHKIFVSFAIVVGAGVGAAAVWNGGADMPARADEHAADAPLFGGAADVAFAQLLWRELSEARLVGPNAVTSRPYEGTEPHGAILVTFQGELEVDGHSGPVIVKNNYMGEGVSVSSVSDNPGLNLAAVTVMYRRAEGYDPDNLDWFWVKYSADGSLDTNAQGRQLAGRIGKNPEDACIGCHKFAPGSDYVFLNDRLAR